MALHILYIHPRDNRIHRSTNECPRYDIKQSTGEAPARKLWGMLSTPSLLLLSGPLWLGVVAPDMALSMAQIELFDI